MRPPVIAALGLTAILSAVPVLAQFQAQGLQMRGASISFRQGDVTYRFQPVADNIIRVQAARDPAALDRSSLAVLPQPADGYGGGLAAVSEAGFVINTPQLRAQIQGQSGVVTFADAAGRTILAEGPRSFEPAEVQGEQTYHIRQQWLPDAAEALFGLGQHQLGLVNIKGYDVELWQRNTDIAVPFLISSKGYGIFWDNPSYTKFGDPRDFEAIPPEKILGSGGAPGGFTATPFSGSSWATGNMGQPGAARVDAAIRNPGGGAVGGGGAAGGRRGGAGESAVRWEGQIVADAAGWYQFKLYANGGVKMWIDDKLVVDHWRQNWLPEHDLARAHFEANSRHAIKVEWIKDGGTHCTLTWKPPVTGSNDNTSLWSHVGEAIDYYFIYGGRGAGALDKVVAGYRQITGQAPMMPIWAFGLWQSRQRYENQQASLDVVKGFRDRKIPFDNIVQDWMYWRENDWGSHNFDPARFPNPGQWIKDLHAMNARVMISVWPKFYPTTDNYQALSSRGYTFPIGPNRDWVGRGYQFAFSDAYSPEARNIFWQQMNERLFSRGIDAWWMDATEPDLVQPSPATLDRMHALMPKTAAGTGARVLNAYPLVSAQAVYEGQRKAAPDQRVFILTRSGYSGMQRYAAATWSGDITSTWTAMHKQIAAGLGMSVSGQPYWTMDSGGFSVPAKFNNRNNAEAVEEWRELNTRWLQFAAFVPLMRSHGETPLREPWQFGGEGSEACKAMVKIDRLRYRLLPYIYSLAGDVTHNGGTMMRPLVMDFPMDATACALNDQYMFGPVFMVSPVTAYKARARSVYLPQTAGAIWYDFWSGRSTEIPSHPEEGMGGISSLTIDASAPYDRIPLHVRAGSIIPLGPELQYTTEKKADPLTVYVYTGADGKFMLYEDDGVTYQYEKGAYARVPLTWNEGAKTLTIGKREGAFPGMLGERTVQVIFVMPAKVVGYSPEAVPDKVVRYAGEVVEVKM